MSVGLLIILVVVLLIVLLAIRMPVALALALSGAIGLLLLRGGDYTTNQLGAIPFSQTHSFSLTIIPMFILMGIFAVRARIAEQVYAVARHVFRWIPGSLGVATVMACAGFAAVSGSSIGTAATMSRLSMGEMRKAGYPASLAGAAVAVAGTLGALIPPSLFLVLYAIMTGESVAAMLAAGIVPGIISAIAYATYIILKAKRNAHEWADRAGQLDRELDKAAGERRAEEKLPRGASGPGGQDSPAEGAVTGAAAAEAATAAGAVDPAALPLTRDRTRLRDLPWRGVVRVGILFLIVLGGIYAGFFTPTESAAVGAFAAAVMLVVEFRKDGLSTLASNFTAALKETAATTSMVFAIVIGSAILSSFFIVARLPQMATEGVEGLGLNPYLTIALLLLLLLPLGMALESISILVISVPLIYPIAMSLGFDGIWLGILIVKFIEIGMVTPPVGITCYVVAGTSNTKVETIFRGVTPFLLVEMAVVALLFAFPVLSTWLPSLIR